MSNIDRAGYIMGDYEAANDLDREGLLTPEPQIIRTPAELEALDRDTLIEKLGPGIRTARQAINVAGYWGIDSVLPAVVVASGEHVRACREALGEA